MNGVEAMEGMSGRNARLIVKTGISRSGDPQITIRDFGPGIATDHIEKIFESFYTTKVRGMGMGLAINRTIIRDHNGTISVSNHPEGGAEFVVTLPKADNHVEDAWSSGGSRSDS